MILLIMPIVFILSSLPISIAGWDIREGSIMASFLIFGISAEIYSVVSIIFGISMIFFSIPGGLISISLKKFLKIF